MLPPELPHSPESPGPCNFLAPPDWSLSLCPQPCRAGQQRWGRGLGKPFLTDVCGVEGGKGYRQSGHPMPRRCWLSLSQALCQARCLHSHPHFSSPSLPCPMSGQNPSTPWKWLRSRPPKTRGAAHTVNGAGRPASAAPTALLLSRFWLLLVFPPEPTPLLPVLSPGLASLRLQSSQDLLDAFLNPRWQLLLAGPFTLHWPHHPALLSSTPIHSFYRPLVSRQNSGSSGPWSPVSTLCSLPQQQLPQQHQAFLHRRAFAHAVLSVETVFPRHST